MSAKMHFFMSDKLCKMLSERNSSGKPDREVAANALMCSAFNPLINCLINGEYVSNPKLRVEGYVTESPFFKEADITELAVLDPDNSLVFLFDVNDEMQVVLRFQSHILSYVDYDRLYNIGEAKVCHPPVFFGTPSSLCLPPTVMPESSSAEEFKRFLLDDIRLLCNYGCYPAKTPAKEKTEENNSTEDVPNFLLHGHSDDPIIHPPLPRKSSTDDIALAESAANPAEPSSPSESDTPVAPVEPEPEPELTDLFPPELLYRTATLAIAEIAGVRFNFTRQSTAAVMKDCDTVTMLMRQGRFMSEVNGKFRVFYTDPRSHSLASVITYTPPLSGPPVIKYELIEIDAYASISTGDAHDESH